jgi:hypothetical protein
MSTALAFRFPESAKPGDFAYRARGIARATGLTERAIYHLVSQNRLPGACRIGGILAIHIPTYVASFQREPECVA